MQTLDNPYHGINAHYNSFIQNTLGEWINFHSLYIASLHNALKAQLLPLGYTVRVEQSLQIRTDSTEKKEHRADLLIFDVSPQRPKIALPTTQMPVALLELLDESAIDDYYPALVITRRQAQDPITWIELLSPTNKPPFSGYRYYAEKRKQLLVSGLGFIEIDFLHQQSPTWKKKIADYSRREQGAYPYHAIVINPHPTLEEGTGAIYGWFVNEMLPRITIHLLGDDQLDFDLDVPYQKVFLEGLLGAEIDYTQKPLQYDSYHPQDQASITHIMTDPEKRP
jgi:hypothetical protein